MAKGKSKKAEMEIVRRNHDIFSVVMVVLLMVSVCAGTYLFINASEKQDEINTLKEEIVRVKNHNCDGVDPEVEE